MTTEQYKELAGWLEQTIGHPQWGVLEHHIREGIEARTTEIINSTEEEHKVSHKRGVVAGMLMQLALPHDIISQFRTQGTVEETTQDSTKTEE